MKYSYMYKHGWESQKQCQKKVTEYIQHDSIYTEVQKQVNLNNILLGIHT